MADLNDFGFSTVSADEYAAQQTTVVNTAKEVASTATASVKPELEKIEKKYTDIINKTEGKIVKVEKWGLLSFAKKIKAYNKGFYIHYKFEAKRETLEEINIQGKESFLKNGGEKFDLIPCLNDSSDHILLFEKLVKKYF